MTPHFKRKLIAVLVAPAMAVPLATLAANEQQSQQQAAQEALQLQPHERRVSQLNDMDVRDPQGENLGSVRDVVIDTRTGEVEYIALSHGGLFGLGEDLYAYPTESFKIGREGEALTLNVTREQLEQSQGFDNEDWPKIRRDTSFWQGIGQQFGTTGQETAQQQGELNYVRGSELVNQNVRDRRGNELGEIQDLVVNLDNGEVRFAVLDVAGNDTMVPVPLDQIEVRADNGTLELQYAQEQLDMSRAFDRSQWEDQLRAQGRE